MRPCHTSKSIKKELCFVRTQNPNVLMMQIRPTMAAPQQIEPGGSSGASLCSAASAVVFLELQWFIHYIPHGSAVWTISPRAVGVLP